MHRGWRERFPRHRLKKAPVSDPSMHHGTCATHVPWCMLGLLTRGVGENVPGHPSGCAACNFKYLAKGPWKGNCRGQCYGCGRSGDLDYLNLCGQLFGKYSQDHLLSPWTKWPLFWQTTISNAFSWMKMIEFRFKVHWNLFPGVEFTMNQHWFR